MKIILITGAFGFFGKSLINALRSSTENFKCFLVYRSNFFKVYDPRFQSIQCDLLNSESTQHLINHIKPTHLVHLAWHVPPKQFWTATENFDWLYASLCLFRVFCENNGQVFIGAGTLAEYDWTCRVLDEITTSLIPNSIYGQCKKSLHDLLIQLRNVYSPDVKIVWLRIGYFFGPGESEEKLISKLIKNVYDELPVNLPSPNFKRPYAHVKYVGESILILLMSHKIEDCAINMSASVAYNFKEIVDFISLKLHKKTRVYYDGHAANSEVLFAKTDIFKKMMGKDIPDTFFEDLENFIIKEGCLKNV